MHSLFFLKAISSAKTTQDMGCFFLCKIRVEMLFIVSPDIREIIMAGTRAKEQTYVSKPDSVVPFSDWRDLLSGAVCTLCEICY